MNLTDAKAKQIILDYVFGNFDLDIIGAKYIPEWNELDSDSRLKAVNNLLTETMKRACIALGRNWGNEDDF